MLENSPDALKTNACKWVELLFDSSECPSLINDPNWVLVFQAALVVVAFYCFAPLVGPLLLWLTKKWYRLSFIVGEKVSRTRTFLRMKVVNTIEHATGNTVYIDRKKALSIIEASEFAKNAKLQGEEQKHLFEYIPSGFGPSPQQRAINQQYYAWLELVLRSFEGAARARDGSAVNEEREKMMRSNEDGSLEYSETALREWLEEKWITKLANRFGPI